MSEIREGDPLAPSCTFWSAIQGIAEQKAGTPQVPLPDCHWIVDIIKNHKGADK